MEVHPHWPVAVVLALAGAYALGCIASGYYLVRHRTGLDVRETGSGGVGATNVGRRLGRSGFVVTLLADALKGALAVEWASHCSTHPTVPWVAVAGVMAGHIWPVQLRFRGGKGVAPFLGALLALDVRLLLGLGALTALAWLALRRFAAAGLIAMVLMPAGAFYATGSVDMAGGLAAAAALILIAHRENIRKEIAGRAPRDRRSPTGDAPPPA